MIDTSKVKFIKDKDKILQLSVTNLTASIQDVMDMARLIHHAKKTWGF